MSNIKCYIISLEHDTVKLKHMKKLCSGLSYPISYFSAVNGEKLTQREFDNISPEKACNKEIGRRLSRGEVGCFLSHKKIYEELILSSFDAALILEDDVDFQCWKLQACIDASMVNKYWDVLFFGHHGKSSIKADTILSFWGRVKLDRIVYLGRPCEKVMGTYGYVIRRKAACDLLNRMEIITKPIDHLTGDHLSNRILCVSEPVVTINDHLSQSFNSMQERSALKRAQKLLQSPGKKFKGLCSILKLIRLIRSVLRDSVRRILPW